MKRTEKSNAYNSKLSWFKIVLKKQGTSYLHGKYRLDRQVSVQVASRNQMQDIEIVVQNTITFRTEQNLLVKFILRSCARPYTV